MFYYVRRGKVLSINSSANAQQRKQPAPFAFLFGPSISHFPFSSSMETEEEEVLQIQRHIEFLPRTNIVILNYDFLLNPFSALLAFAHINRLVRISHAGTNLEHSYFPIVASSATLSSITIPRYLSRYVRYLFFTTTTTTNQHQQSININNDPQQRRPKTEATPDFEWRNN